MHFWNTPCPSQSLDRGSSENWLAYDGATDPRGRVESQRALTLSRPKSKRLDVVTIAPAIGSSATSNVVNNNIAKPGKVLQTRARWVSSAITLKAREYVARSVFSVSTLTRRAEGSVSL
jgi:hypothetical protein